MRLAFAHLWLMVAMPLRAAGSDSGGSPASTPRDERVVIHVVDIEQVHEYTVAAGPSALRLLEARRVTPTEDLRHKALAEVLRAVDEAKRNRAGAASELGRPSFRTVKWSHLSPDRATALVGYEDPFDVRRSAAVVRVADNSEPWDLKLHGNVRDSLWSSDSKTVLVLESTERWLKSPRGLLRILVGHPVPLSTLLLTACHVETRQCRRIQIAADIEFATAHLQRAGAEGQDATP